MDEGGLRALGRALAVRGWQPRLAVAVGVLTVLAMVFLEFKLARANDTDAARDVPLLASSALAWGAGILLAFATASRVLTRDRDEGILLLCRLRGHRDQAYLWSRTGGLALALLSVIGSGTLVVGIVTAALARGPVELTVQTTVAGLVFALAFSGLMAAVAVAALGARTRAGGYMALLMVLALPELLQPLSVHVLPAGWGELSSIPGALGALRTALIPSHEDLAGFLRAFAVVLVFTALALTLARRAVAQADVPKAAPP